MSSDLELEMQWQIAAAKLPKPVPEYLFHQTRKWRFDFCWPELKLALEVEGGNWKQGRHTRGSGFEEDCEKYCEAAIAGYRLLRATGGQVRSGQALKWLERAINGQEQGREAIRRSALHTLQISTPSRRQSRRVSPPANGAVAKE